MYSAESCDVEGVVGPDWKDGSGLQNTLGEEVSGPMISPASCGQGSLFADRVKGIDLLKYGMVLEGSRACVGCLSFL
jgi:hypothetical protein